MQATGAPAAARWRPGRPFGPVRRRTRRPAPHQASGSRVRPLPATSPGITACRPVGRWLCWCRDPSYGSCFWRVLPGPYLEGGVAGRGGRSRCPRRRVPGGAAVAGVPISSSMTRPGDAAVLNPRREVCRRWLGRWPARWWTVGAPIGGWHGRTARACTGPSPPVRELSGHVTRGSHG
jgi:hypothetical protein